MLDDVPSRLTILKSPGLADVELDSSTIAFISAWISTVDWDQYEEAIVIADLNSIYFILCRHGGEDTEPDYDYARRTPDGWHLLKNKSRAEARTQVLANIIAGNVEYIDISDRWLIGFNDSNNGGNMDGEEEGNTEQD